LRPRCSRAGDLLCSRERCTGTVYRGGCPVGSCARRAAVSVGRSGTTADPARPGERYLPRSLGSTWGWPRPDVPSQTDVGKENPTGRDAFRAQHRLKGQSRATAMMEPCRDRVRRSTRAVLSSGCHRRCVPEHRPSGPPAAAQCRSIGAVRASRTGYRMLDHRRIAIQSGRRVSGRASDFVEMRSLPECD